MKRKLGCAGTAFLVLLLFSAFTYIVAPVQLVFRLFTGWAFHLVGFAPRLRIDGVEVLGFFVALAVFAGGAHLFLRWLWAATGRGAWAPRWSALGVGLLFVMFATSVASAGIAHHLAWLAAGDAPLTKNSWLGVEFILRRVCADFDDRKDPAMLQAAIERRAIPSKFEVAVFPGPRVLVVPRDSEELEKNGFVVCDAESRMESKPRPAAELDAALAELTSGPR